MWKICGSKKILKDKTHAQTEQYMSNNSPLEATEHNELCTTHMVKCTYIDAMNKKDS